MKSKSCGTCAKAVPAVFCVPYSQYREPCSKGIYGCPYEPSKTSLEANHRQFKDDEQARTVSPHE